MLLYLYLSFYLSLPIYVTLHKKGSFPLRIFSVNVTKSAGNWFFVQCNHNQSVLFLDWTVHVLTKKNIYIYIYIYIYTPFWKECHFMVNIYFSWHFFVTFKVYLITIKWHYFPSEHSWRFGKNREVLRFEYDVRCHFIDIISLCYVKFIFSKCKCGDWWRA